MLEMISGGSSEHSLGKNGQTQSVAAVSVFNSFEALAEEDTECNECDNMPAEPYLSDEPYKNQKSGPKIVKSDSDQIQKSGPMTSDETYFQKIGDKILKSGPKIVKSDSDQIQKSGPMTSDETYLQKINPKVSTSDFKMAGVNFVQKPTCDNACCSLVTDGLQWHGQNGSCGVVGCSSSIVNSSSPLKNFVKCDLNNETGDNDSMKIDCITPNIPAVLKSIPDTSIIPPVPTYLDHNGDNCACTSGCGANGWCTVTKSRRRKRRDHLKVQPVHFAPAEPLRAFGVGSDCWMSEDQGYVKVTTEMDSGCVQSVAPPTLLPDIPIAKSHGQQIGQKYQVANGEIIPNVGEKSIPMVLSSGENAHHTYQMADVTGPLTSVGDICDGNNIVVFGKKGGIVMDLATHSCTPFPRINRRYKWEFWVSTNSPDSAPVFSRHG